jgi:hypothetical protein
MKHSSYSDEKEKKFDMNLNFGGSSRLHEPSSVFKTSLTNALFDEKHEGGVKWKMRENGNESLGSVEVVAVIDVEEMNNGGWWMFRECFFVFESDVKVDWSSTGFSLAEGFQIEKLVREATTDGQVMVLRLARASKSNRISGNNWLRVWYSLFLFDFNNIISTSFLSNFILVNHKQTNFIILPRHREFVIEKTIPS